MVSAYFKKNFNSKHHFQLDAFISFYTSFQYLKINLMQPPPVPYLKQISQQCFNTQFLMQNFVLFYFSFRWVFFFLVLLHDVFIWINELLWAIVEIELWRYLLNSHLFNAITPNFCHISDASFKSFILLCHFMHRDPCFEFVITQILSPRTWSSVFL